MEIERKWLVDGFPADGTWPLLKEAAVWQGYIATAPVVRIRESRTEDKSTYVLCFKGKGTLAREEIETDISQELFDKLTVFTGKDLVRKDYKVYLLPGGEHLEVSLVDAGRASAFYYAEVEFDTLAAAHAFVPPAYLGAEKTESADFSMSAYWKKTRG
ncbi:MAG: CYTH domain-containing protein [Ruthenibacterium sp.]